MKFEATPAAIALKKERGEPIEAVANWTLRQARYRLPTAREYVKAKIGTEHTPQATVCHDEGLLFVRDANHIKAYTTAELGL